MLDRAVLLLVAATPAGAAPFSPRWLPAHALRWLALDLGSASDDDGLGGWAAGVRFHDDMHAGLTTPGLDLALAGLLSGGLLVADAGLWALRGQAACDVRRQMLRLDARTAAALTRAAGRWAAQGQPREAVAGPRAAVITAASVGGLLG